MPIVNPDNNSLTSGIQEAIDSCIDGFVILGSGEYHIRKSLIIRSGTRLISSNKAILVNDIEDGFEPFIRVEPYADIEYLIANSNGKSGISLGDSRKNNNINVGYLKVYNTGTNYEKEPMSAILIRGYNIAIDTVDIYRGNVGLSIEHAADIRIKEMQIVACSTGIRVFNANNLSFSNFSIDSCNYTGMQVDSTENSYFQGTIWSNTKDYKGINNTCGLLIGKYSKTPSRNIRMNLRIIDSGITGLAISNTRNIYIDAIISNTSGNQIETGINFGENIENIDITGIMDKIKTPFTGYIKGRNSMIVIDP